MEPLSPTAPQFASTARPEPAAPASPATRPGAAPEERNPGYLKIDSKPQGYKKYGIGGGIAAVILASAGLAAYWLSPAKDASLEEAVAAQGSPATTVATPVAVPAPAAMPELGLPVGPASAVAAAAPIATPAAPTRPASEILPATSPAAPLVATQNAQAELNMAQAQRKAEALALAKQAARDALDKQRALDKAKLSKTNRTLDDLLK